MLPGHIVWELDSLGRHGLKHWPQTIQTLINLITDKIIIKGDGIFIGIIGNF